MSKVLLLLKSRVQLSQLQLDLARGHQEANTDVLIKPHSFAVLTHVLLMQCKAPQQFSSNCPASCRIAHEVHL